MGKRRKRQGVTRMADGYDSRESPTGSFNIGEFVARQKPSSINVWLDFDGRDTVLYQGNQIGRSGLKLTIDKAGLVVGRGTSADIEILNDRVSRRHLRLSYDQTLERVTIQDMNSLNGTRMDGIRVHNYQRNLRSPSTLDLGGSQMRLSYT